MAAHPSGSRIPLNTLAMAFGAAGLADVWSTVGQTFHWPVLVGDAFWLVAAITWVWLIVAHIARGARSSDPLVGQLRHPVQGPLAALVPVVGMLLGAALFTLSSAAGITLVLISIATSTIYAAWLLSFWMRGNFTIDAVHGGYFLPTVAAGLVAGTAAADVGLKSLAIASFAVGLFFWVVLFTLIFTRLAIRPPLPGPLVPTLAIFLAPPAVAGGAWFAIAGDKSSALGIALGGLTVLMLLMQLTLIPLYRKLSFSLGFWSFTFPLAAAFRVGIIWLSIGKPVGWQAIAIALLALITAFVAAIGVASFRVYLRDHRSHRAAAEDQLASADDRAANS